MECIRNLIQGNLVKIDQICMYKRPFALRTHPVRVGSIGSRFAYAIFNRLRHKEPFRVRIRHAHSYPGDPPGGKEEITGHQPTSTQVQRFEDQ